MPRLRAHHLAKPGVIDTAETVARLADVKFPVGEWREGESRRFDYECRQTERGKMVVKRRASIVTIVALDFPCGEVPHCLSYRWRHIDAESGAVLDHRNYVFTPGRGLSGETRVP